MKQRPKTQRRARRPGANLVPSFEECLTFVMDMISHSRDGLNSTTLTPKEKQRFRQMERKADMLDLENYRDILRRVLAPGLHDMTPESKAHVDVVHEELREFFKRYEILGWQVVPGGATQQQVLWTLTHRFFLPWIALKLAFRLSEDSDVGEITDDCWFIPLHGGAMASCVTKVIDRFVRSDSESIAQLARRLYDHFPTQKQVSHAKELEGDLSKYSKLKTTPSDMTISLLVESTDAVPHLRLWLVLARFIDRCVRDALTVFDKGQVLKLLNFFMLCLSHFRGVLKEVRSEIPPNDGDKVWLWLSSQTFMGNTPGQEERFFPLMDEFMNELPRRITAELRRAVGGRELNPLPRNMAELDAGRWQMRGHVQIPEEIEGAPIRATVTAAVEASRRHFRGRINRAVALRAVQRFKFLGLGTFVATAEGRPGFVNDEDAALAEVECKRLFHVIYKQTPTTHGPHVALAFLEYLIAPCRPKTAKDRELAQELFKIASELLRRSNNAGAVHYFQGCLHALDGRPQQALRSFAEARKLGRELCGPFWIGLIRTALMTAEGADAKRERKNFAKVARLIGLFSNDATPRTNEMKAQMNEDEFRRSWFGSFRPFPQATS